MPSRLSYSLLVVTLLIAGAATVLDAQMPGSGGFGGGRRGGFGGMRRGGGGMENPLPTASQLEGPPSPEFFADRFELDSSQAQAYRQVYDSFMTATAPQRDSAKAARQAIDAAFQERDRASARESVPLLRRLADALAKEDKHFDDRLKGVITSSQLKQYRKWKDDQRRQEEAERRERFGGGRPPGP